MIETFLRSAKVVNNVDEMIVKDREMNEIEKAQVAQWMSILESILKYKSNNEVNVFDLVKRSYDKEIEVEFYPRQTVDDLKDNIKDFVYSTRMSLKQKGAWDEADLAQKYEYWCGMDVIHSEYYNRREERLGRKEKTGSKRTDSAEINDEKVTIEEIKDDSRKISSEDKKDESKVDKEEHDSKQALINEDENSDSDASNKEEEEGDKEEKKLEGNKGEDSNREGSKKEDIEEEKKESQVELESIDVKVKKTSEKASKLRGDFVEETESVPESESLLSESVNSIDIPAGAPLVPRQGDLTLKGMIISPEYTSNYARRVSFIQFDYWNMLTIPEKIEFWLFHLTGKQRVKLWACMKFSDRTVKEYVDEQLGDIRDQTTLLSVWEYLSQKNKDDEVRQEAGWNEGNHTIMHKIAIAKRLLFDEKIRKKQETYNIFITALLKKLNEKKLKHFTDAPKKIEAPKIDSCLLRCFVKKKAKDETENMTIEQLRKFVLSSAEANYKIFSTIWPDEERMFFWHLLTYTGQAEMFYNRMSGPLIGEGNVIKDLESDIMATFLVVEYAQSREEYSPGEALDELLEKELDIRMYNRYLGLANLQAKLHSLRLMQEREEMLDKELEEQKKEFRKLNDAHVKNEAKIENYNKRLRYHQCVLTDICYLMCSHALIPCCLIAI
eukprot:TRINITY_DN6644_c0_g1_i8.p1 TRINITY_DN6644_c0_g1~~TRINITY_DN6644_c0_g1_i8.p1  ORF type:complete len:667 (-),score=260.70 TRINITY_DN6644_c0_g1_i8:2874-4874(-)